ncbi:potassium channel subfamily K member 18-like [Physella acuta]|uniref:potassium channel subfamily K member 18-like n=1 Tax=Physella acuta TaxID=109671 RepID=UPI0027DD7458|nr:potassium channel subfamily K member 18-like [Physella acuta]
MVDKSPLDDYSNLEPKKKEDAPQKDPPKPEAEKNNPPQDDGATPKGNEAKDNANPSTSVATEDESAKMRDNELPSEAERRNSCKYLLIEVVMHFGKVMSYCVLLIFLILYSVVGALLFQYLETEAIRTLNKNVTLGDLKKNFVDKILDAANVNHTILAFNPETIARVDEVVHEFMTQVVHFAEAQQKVEVNDWSFPSSFLYSVTLITTIGYGNIVPKTTAGRICTIIYSIIGIPLTLLYLSNVGAIMANLFKIFFTFIISILTKLNCLKAKARRKDHVPIYISLIIIGSYLFLGAVLFSSWQKDWTFIIALYFCFITLSTIGLGDFVFGSDIREFSDSKPIFGVLYLIVGLSVLSMTFNLMQEDIAMKANAVLIRLGLRAAMKKAQMQVAN